MTTEHPSKASKFSRTAIWITAVVVIIAVAALCWAICCRTSSNSTMPNVTMTNLKGEQITTAQLYGKVTLIQFWATTCAICVAEMPHMIATYQRFHPKGLEYVAIAMSDDPPNLVVDYSETRQLPFHVALDLDGKLAQAFGNVAATPTFFLIDKQGKIMRRYEGAPPLEELQRLIDEALAT